MYGHNDEQTDEATEKWRLSKHVCSSLDSVQDLIVAYISRKTRFLHRRYGQTDRPSYRDAFLTDASKNGGESRCMKKKDRQRQIEKQKGRDRERDKKRNGQ